MHFAKGFIKRISPQLSPSLCNTLSLCLVYPTDPLALLFTCFRRGSLWPFSLSSLRTLARQAVLLRSVLEPMAVLQAWPTDQIRRKAGRAMRCVGFLLRFISKTMLKCSKALQKILSNALQKTRKDSAMTRSSTVLPKKFVRVWQAVGSSCKTRHCTTRSNRPWLMRQ